MFRGPVLRSLFVAAALALAAPAQAAPRVLVKVDRLALQADSGVRLEEGIGAQAGQSTLWLMAGSSFWQLQPSHGTVLAADGVGARRGPAGCKAVSRWAPVASSPLRAGTFYCVMTRAGDYGEIKIDAVTPSRVTISYTLWDGL
jgi:hypothetical protein